MDVMDMNTAMSRAAILQMPGNGKNQPWSAADIFLLAQWYVINRLHFQAATDASSSKHTAHLAPAFLYVCLSFLHSC